MLEGVHAWRLAQVVEEGISRILRVFEGELQEGGGVVPLAHRPHSHTDDACLEAGPEVRCTDGEEEVETGKVAGELGAGDQRAYDYVAQRVPDEADLGRVSRHIGNVFEHLGE